MTTKPHAPTRGERGLASFHRMVAYASFGAAMCLIGASVTALYWFAGVIGLPTPARILVALAIEVMAASLAASATTAYKEGGKVDISAWVGFAFFIGVSAYANVLHVIVYVDTTLAPAWFGTTAFITAACIFAAACPLGGTWGIHRFGWLRAHGADAHWVEDTAGNTLAPAPRAETKRPAPAREAVARAAALTPVKSASEAKEAARALYEQALRAQPGVKPNGALIHAQLQHLPGAPSHKATTRGWVKRWWDAESVVTAISAA